MATFFMSKICPLGEKAFPLPRKMKYCFTYKADTLAALRLTVLLLMVCLPMVIMAQRPRVGLVLGGGGAKGAAEVGVLKVIERAGIPIDCIVGTSIGSIVGGLYATGYTAVELDSIFRAQAWLSLLTDRREDLTPYPYKKVDGMTYVFGFPIYDTENVRQGALGALRGKHVEQMLDSLMGFRGFNEFDKLKIPFQCVACDFRNAREVVLSDGFPANAMRASMAIPGIFKPVKWEGMTLVDGGMVNNLPVDVARAMGADIVIAIDLQQAEPKLPKKRFTTVEKVGGWMGLGELVQWATRRPDVAKYQKNRKAADIYIHPILPDYDASSFDQSSVEVMLELGEQEGRRHWNELVALKRKLSPNKKYVTRPVSKRKVTIHYEK